MASSITFTVWPTRRQFEAIVSKDDYYDFERAYFDAHLEAATSAASYNCETYVTVEASLEHCTFEPGAYLDKTSHLRRIMRLGISRSYFSFETRSWHPLPIDPEADEGHIISRRLLPPPKKKE